MKAQVLSWYISLVALVATAIGAFGLAGPWLVSQPDTVTVVMGIAVYLIGLPTVGFMGWKLVETILDFHKQLRNTEEVSQ